MLEYLMMIVVVIMSVVVHEIAHGYLALYWGDDTAKNMGRLTLNPLKHLDLVGSLIVPLITLFFNIGILGWAKPVIYNPNNFRNYRWGELSVALAGPLSNLFLAIVFSIIFRFAGPYIPKEFLGFALAVVAINVTLFIFNLVPIPPLDGSKVLFNVFAKFFMRFKRQYEAYSFFLILFFVLFLWQIFMPVVKYLVLLLTGIA